MNSLRGSLSNIPSALGNIISNIPTPTSILNRNEADNHASSLSSLSGDETTSSTTDKSQAIPSSLITEEWQLILGQNATVDELEVAIERSKELVLNTEECSIERKWLVRHLVELRFRLSEIQDVLDDPKTNKTNTMVILGHHFVARHIKDIHKTTRQYCDHCTGIIWSVMQASYYCADCSFRVHYKCVDSVIRVCAHVIASEQDNVLADICPEIGLSLQQYKCAECEAALNFKGSWTEPRICDYSGLYYCQTCHWNDLSVIPARIIHNWDFKPRRVSRASLQELALLHDRPIINLEERNPKLFVYIQNLSLVLKLRENLNHMKKYLTECRLAANLKLIETNIGQKRHLIQSTAMYNMDDLLSVENGSIVGFLNRIYRTFDSHIRNCDICTGKGYICEICSNVEVMYPYDDGAVQCDKCLTLFHRACWVRKNMTCPRCIRIEDRRLHIVNEDDGDDDDDDYQLHSQQA